MPEQTPAIAWERVEKHYGATVAVAGVSVSVAAGSFTALVGASGSGKSTLLKTVTRLVEPDAGRVLLDGRDVGGEPAPALRRRIGYVFQHVGLFPHMTVGENVAIGPRIMDGAAADIPRWLDLVELPAAIAARMPHELSGGQRQRVGIARALAPGAKLLLLDEALGALDPVTRDAIGRRLRDLHDALGLTTVLVTHDMAEALLLGDRVLVMREGRIVADESPAALVAGSGGEDAQALVRVPREQAERLAALARARSGR